MKRWKPSPSMVVAGIALFVSLGGTSMAAMSYAERAGSVDGKSAVYSGATLRQAAGKLVATNRSGPNKGRLPGKFVADVGKTSTISKVFEVADNAPGAPQTVWSQSGLGTLTATCNDQNNTVGIEDPISVITFLNQSGEAVNLARRVGNGDGSLSVAANQTAASLSIGGSNTFTFHVEKRGQNAIITGGVRQDGRGTPAATCVVFGVVTQVLP
ncbi:MAG TPA: hypothetical protein VNS09_00910 [Solirubrobacter sp.]|nr:hypothetical protein [Solirubrobacter sp.]